MPHCPITDDLLDGKMHVIGIEPTGQLIFVDAGIPKLYTTWETLADFGLATLRPEEVARLKSLKLRDEDRQLLDRWQEPDTRTSGEE